MNLLLLNIFITYIRAEEKCYALVTGGRFKQSYKQMFISSLSFFLIWVFESRDLYNSDFYSYILIGFFEFSKNSSLLH